MADETIIQRIDIEGDQDVSRKLDSVGKSVEKTFSDIEKSAESANKGLANVGQGAQDAGQKLNSGLNVGPTVERLKQIEQAATQFGASLRNVGSAAVSFGTRVATLGTAAVTVGIGLLQMVSGLTETARGADEASKSNRELVAEVRNASSQFVEMQQRAVSNRRALSDLSDAFARGKISAEQYSEQLTDLRIRQRKDAQDARELALIQNQAREDQARSIARLQKEQQKQQAFNALQKRFGSDLANSLVNLGNSVDNFFQQFNQGPSTLARVADAIKSLLDNSGEKIIDWYNRIGDALSKAFNLNTGGGSIDGFRKKFEELGERITQLVENQIAPAIRKFMQILTQVAGVINTVFGTNIGPEGIILIAIIGKLTGAFNLLWASLGVGVAAVRLLVTAFGPWGVVIAAIIVALTYLATQIDWAALTAKVKEVIGGVIEWLRQLPTTVSQFITDQLNKVREFLNGVWESIKQAFNDAWQLVKDGMSSAAKAVTDAWQSVFNWFEKKIQSLIDWWNKVIAKVKEYVSADSSAGGQGGSGRAQGGPIYGPGTQTSDSIPIWASRDEWVIKARAAKYYGNRFMSAINNMRIPKKLLQFSLGGSVSDALAGLSVPRTHFATGGPVVAPSSRTLNLTIDGQSFPGLSVPEDTAESLTRFAVSRQVRSAGRKPGWYGGKR